MNKFIDLREMLVQTQNPETLYVNFLDTYEYKNQWKHSEGKLLSHHVKILQELTSREIQEKDELMHLGKNEYLDKLIIDQLLKYSTGEKMLSLKKRVTTIFKNKEYNKLSLYSLLDLCIECNFEVLSKEHLLLLIMKYKKEYLLFSLLLEYALVFDVQIEKTLVRMLREKYPETIQIQLLETIFSLDPDEYTREKVFEDEKSTHLYELYIKPSPPIWDRTPHTLVLLQSMFHGDFDDSGKGNNGGLAVLLKGLGNELAKQEKIGFVVTLAIQDGKKDKPLWKEYDENHFLIRIPLYLETNSKRFIQREWFIKRSVFRLLDRLSITPDIFHVRYLDNASKAIAHLGHEMGKKVAVTLTPDPHRGLFNIDGKIKQMTVSEILENANKIKIGDELIAQSDAIIGIGENKVKKELESYFPQLRFLKNQNKLVMISEGIQLEEKSTCLSSDQQSMYASVLAEVPKDFFKRSIILNVGRLNPVKGQDTLLKAWGNSNLWKEYNLLFIGGDLDSPNHEEQSMIGEFQKYIDKRPELVPHFYHMGALPNKIIRCMEKEIKGLPTSFPPLYVCSSQKEEFGLAILEALSQEFIVIAPKKGGVGTYIRNNENGFLIETNNWESMAKEIEEIHALLKKDKEKGSQIQKSGKATVYEHFSMEKIADRFYEMYLSLIEETTYAS